MFDKWVGWNDQKIVYCIIPLFTMKDNLTKTECRIRTGVVDQLISLYFSNV